MKISPAVLLTLIALEGFVLLSVEILAIRLLAPYCGQSIDGVAVIITAILLPMAYGYHYAGSWQGQNDNAVIAKLTRNVLWAQAILTFSLSYLFVDFFHNWILIPLGIHHHLLITACYAVLLIYPVFCLAQTVPLASFFFAEKKPQEAAGLVLFYSTCGSFCGAIITSLVLMRYFGVNGSVMSILSALYVMVLILSLPRFTAAFWLSSLLALLAWHLNDSILMHALGIIQQTPYTTIRIIHMDDEQTKILSINHSASAKTSHDPYKRFAYIQILEKRLLHVDKPLDVLILGASGFTLGANIGQHDYDFVDIEDTLADIANKHLKALGPHQHFIAMPATAYLMQHHKTYDRIVIDLYSNPKHTPAHLLSQEFLMLAKSKLKSQGILAINTVVDPRLTDRYAQRVDNTIRAALGHVSRHIVPDKPNSPCNVLYFYYQHAHDDEAIYSQNHNTADFDS